MNKEQLLLKMQAHGINSVSSDNVDGVLSECFRLLDGYSTNFTKWKNLMHNYELGNSSFYEVIFYSPGEDYEETVKYRFFISCIQKNLGDYIEKEILDNNIKFFIYHDGEVWPKIKTIKHNFKSLDGKNEKN